MKKVIYAFLGLAVVSAAGIAAYFYLKPQAEIIAGFLPFSTFRDFDPPGTVYRVDRGDVTHKVIQLSPAVTEAAETTYNTEAAIGFSVDQLLDAVAVGEACKPATGNYEAGLRDTVTVKSVDGFREFTNDAALDPLLSELKKQFESVAITYRGDNTYWIIRETIKTDNVDYSASRDWLAKAKVAASLEGCADDVVKTASGEVKIDFGSERTVSLQKTFEKPLRGWYRPERVDVAPDRTESPTVGGQRFNVEIVKAPESAIAASSDEDGDPIDRFEGLPRI